MISKYKKGNMKTILLGAIILVILGGIGIALNFSRSQVEKPAAIAEELITNIYTVDAERVAKFNTPIPKPAGDVNSEEYNKKYGEEFFKYMKLVDKNIVPLMTSEGYQNTVSNQFSTRSILACVEDNYTAKVTEVTLGENVYKEYKDNDKVRYPYEVKFDFISSDGKTKQAGIAKGNLELIKEDGKWKVCLYGITQFPKLYLQLRK